jgi:hypothetical protein
LSEPAHPPWKAVQKRIRAAEETVFMLHVHEVWLQVSGRRNSVRSRDGGRLQEFKRLKPTVGTGCFGHRRPELL